MPEVELLVHGELNDFLPARRRGRPLVLRTSPNATAKHAIEAAGVPHTEVGAVLVNGEPVAFGHRLHDGDRLSVLPVLPQLAVSPVLPAAAAGAAAPAPSVRLRPPLPAEPRFAADAHLGRLARYLRFLGHDTLFRNDWADPELAAIAAAEHRVLLTRDRALLMHRGVVHGCYVRASAPREQLRELAARLGLDLAAPRPARCMICNTPVEPVDKARVDGRLPERTRAAHDRFWRCPHCDRVYWRGSHWQRLRETLSAAGRPTIEDQKTGWRTREEP